MLNMDASKIQFTGAWPFEVPNEEDALGQRLYKAWQALGPILDDAVSAIQRVNLDQSLSDLGKAQARGTAARAALSRVEPITTVLQDGEAEVLRLNTGLESTARRVLMTDATAAARQGWLVTWFLALKPEDRHLAITEGIRATDREFLGALLALPATVQTISIPELPNWRKKIEDTYLRSVNPLEIARKEALGKACECLERAIDQVTTKIEGEGQILGTVEDQMRTRLQGHPRE